MTMPMRSIYLLCFVLLATAAILLLRLDVAAKDRRQTRAELRKKKARYRSPSKIGSHITRWHARNQTLLEENRVSKGTYALMLVLCSCGGFLAGRAIFASPLLSAFVAVASLALPTALYSFRRDKQMLVRAEKLNADMMVLSNSYLVTHDLISTVQANLDLLEISRPFRDFLTYVTYFDSDVESGLRRMENEVSNAYFSQWIDALVMAQKDRSLAYVSISIVESMRDSLAAQRESNAALIVVWRDYFTVLALIFASPLIIRTLMPDAYWLLTSSLIGQGILLLLVIAVAYSVVRALQINRPLAM